MLFFIVCAILIITVCVFFHIFHIFLKEYLNDVTNYDKKLYKKLISIKPLQ